ncbi:threonine aldolase family protein [Spirochaeta thermophila]|nr:beta-eliminating lyase-related protein [Spirochaeta thermophila]
MKSSLFASDNTAPVHPRIVEALLAANEGPALAYGEDPLSARARSLLREQTGARHVFFLHTGTAANVVGMAPFLRPYHAVITSHIAHLNTHECGALQRATGARILPVVTPDGKLTPEHVEPFLHASGNPHESQPAIVSITQPTERGTLYFPHEIRALADLTHRHGLLLHVDGARLPQAAAALGLSLRALTAECGVDILSLGGAKCGLMYGEAVLLWVDTKEMPFHLKQTMQLAPKMRFIAAQFLALYEDDLWLGLARTANTRAQHLARELAALGITIAYPVETNAVFPRLPAPVARRLLAHYTFYQWEDDIHRLMTSYATREEDIETFVRELRSILEAV